MALSTYTYETLFSHTSTLVINTPDGHKHIDLVRVSFYHDNIKGLIVQYGDSQGNKYEEKVLHEKLIKVIS